MESENYESLMLELRQDPAAMICGGPPSDPLKIRAAEAIKDLLALNKQLQINHDCAWQNNRILEKERQRLEGIVRNGL